MTTIIIYAAKTIVCSCAFILLYMWQFHKKVHYRYCRIYLIATMLLSVLIPALNVPIYPNRALQAQSDVQYVGVATASSSLSDVAVTNREIVDYIEPSTVVAPSANTAAAPATVKKTNWKSIGLIIYLSFIAISLVLTIRGLLKIWRLRTESELVVRQDFNIAKNSNVKTPFTFFKTIFVGNNYTDDEWRQIISHEASHARHLHSVERMAMALLRTIFWFNPFMWIAAKRLEEVQEWQADNDAIGDGYAIEQYRLTILHQIFGYTPDLSLGMSNSFTKNRFIMMTQQLNRKCTRPAVLAAAVAAGAFFAFGCTTQTFARNGQTSDSEPVASTNRDTMTFSRKLPSGNYYDTTYSTITFHFDRFNGDSENEAVNNRYRSVSEGEKSIETIEFLCNGRKVCYAVASGVSEARDPQSSELDWVNEKTTILLEGHLIPFADFKKLTKNSIGAIHYLHLNSNMDFVYVRSYGYMTSSEKYRIYHPQSTFCKKLPEVVPIALIKYVSIDNDFVELCLNETTTKTTYILVVPNMADNFCINGKFGSIEKFRKVFDSQFNNKSITIYRNAAAKKRFGNEYDYVIDAESTYNVTEVEDLQLGTKLFEESITVGENNTKTFHELLTSGTQYYIKVDTKNPSSSGQMTAAFTDDDGNWYGRIERLKSDQSEIVSFYCYRTGYYTIDVRSKNGDEVSGVYTLWGKNE
ncbi:MAG: M48 family metalloprotease [Salinivirgaceae bacterium]|nr:M48 family metalloprotease [Salinivirgaceae bacterium]